MRIYEGLFIFPSEDKGKPFEEREKAIEDLIKKYKGSVSQKTDLGKKTLGYLVKNNRDGRVALFDMSMDPSQVASFRGDLELSEDIIKYTITLKNPELAKDASAPKAEKKPAKAAAVKS